MKRLEQIALGAGLLVFYGMLVYTAGLAGPFALVAACLLLSGAVTFLWTRSRLPHAQLWVMPTILAVAVVLCLGLLSLSRPVNAWYALAVPAAAAAGIATMFAMHWDRARCELCNRRLRTQSVVFHCPRCRLRVCEESCWSFEHRRCRLCLEQRVPVLPIETQWWNRTTGPRFEQGRCQVCLGGAAQTDLRPCPHCRRLQCRDCWDHGNATCSLCGGTLPNLPESLTMAVAETTD